VTKTPSEDGWALPKITESKCLLPEAVSLIRELIIGMQEYRESTKQKAEAFLAKVGDGKAAE
jgi:hypothetical protein